MTFANIHASCVALGRAGESFGAPPDAGVLLLGESGAGKSDLALRLIERGAELVADDRTELFSRDNALRACAPAALAGLIEVRGVGIVALPHRSDVRIALAVMLSPPEFISRLPRTLRYMPPAELAVPADNFPPLLHLAAFEQSAPARIAAAAAAHAHALFREDRNPK